MAQQQPQSDRFLGVQPVVAALAAVSVGLSAWPALAAFRLPPIDSGMMLASFRVQHASMVGIMLELATRRHAETCMQNLLPSRSTQMREGFQWQQPRNGESA